MTKVLWKSRTISRGKKGSGWLSICVMEMLARLIASSSLWNVRLGCVARAFSCIREVPRNLAINFSKPGRRGCLPLLVRGCAGEELWHKSNVVGDWLKVLWETKPFAHLDIWTMVDGIIAHGLKSWEAHLQSCSNALIDAHFIHSLKRKCERTAILKQCLHQPLTSVLLESNDYCQAFIKMNKHL